MEEKHESTFTRWIQFLRRWVAAMEYDPIVDLHQRVQRLEAREEERRPRGRSASPHRSSS